MTSTIYLDNAATTRVAPAVAALVLECMQEDFGNPSSVHRFGIAAERRVKQARAELRAAVGDPEGALGDIYFTSGGTEADAIGVLAAARARAARGQHVVCSAVEHPAVLESVGLLEREGFRATRVAVTSAGVVDVARFLAAVEANTQVAALMLVQNELGTCMPVAEVARAIKARHPQIHIHCDAVQGLGKIPIDAHTLDVDSLALSAHKLGGPKGVGALWLRKGARVTPLWAGGGQQRGVRSGTENVPGIAGFGLAARLATAQLDAQRVTWTRLAATLVTRVRAAGVDVRENGAGAPRAPHILSLALPGCPAEPLLHALEARGVLCSAGSACAAKHKGPSHVLAALGLGDDVGTLRISFAQDTSEKDVARAAEALIDARQSL
jgi:cysteine desulfurase